MDVFQIVSCIIIPIICAAVFPAIKGIYVRISTLETQLLTKVNDKQVRQLLEDKIDPIHQDLKEIKDQLSNIINRLIDR